ncbi:MAG: sulfotransferase family protein [Bacteroidetes bacterium]|nr:sulfotransferase family protein [Bacteroidota bacterium]
MYSFAQRPDTVVYDEPLYGHYLNNTPAKNYHPGADEVLSTMETDGEKVIDMMMGDHPKEVVFFKNMGHHLLKLNTSFMRSVCNVILTRDPAEVIPSFAKEIENPSMVDIGFETQVNLLNLLNKMKAQVIVVDSNTILKNPGQELDKLCNTIGIPFFKEMLAWKPGPRPEDGIWAKYWYKNVHASNGFQPYKMREIILDETLQPLYQRAMPFYKQLMEFSQ